MLTRSCCRNFFRPIFQDFTHDLSLFQISNDSRHFICSSSLKNHANHSNLFSQNYSNRIKGKHLSFENYGLITSLNYFSTSTNSINSDSNSGLSDIKSISLQDKKIIAKYLGLKPPFLNETGVKVSTDLNELEFNFFYPHLNNENDIRLCPVRYCGLNSHSLCDLINDTKSESINLCKNEERPEFLFFTFEKNIPESFDDINKSTDNQILVIFDNIFDALAFYQQTKLPTIVVKLLQSFSNECFTKFCTKLENSYQKIHLWPKAGSDFQNLRKLCVENFDIQKIYFLISDKSSSQMLLEDPKEKFEVILRNATLLHHPHILGFDDLKEEVFTEFSDPSISGVQWSRFDKLNEHLKGHREGELTIVTGATGCGKTTFVSEYSLDLCMQGVPTLWGSFEIKNVRLIKMMMTQFSRKSLSFTDKKIFEEESLNFSKLPLYFLKFHGQTDVEAFMNASKHAVLAFGIKHIVIDNLQFMLGMNVESNYDRFLKQDFLISSLRQFSTEYNCHITLVAHPRKEKEEISLSNNSLYGGIKASQEADNVLIIMNKFNARYRCNKYIQITKNRFNGSLGIVPLYFDKNTLCFSSTMMNNINSNQASHQIGTANTSHTTTTSSTFYEDNNTNDEIGNVKEYVSDRMRNLLEN